MPRILALLLPLLLTGAFLCAPAAVAGDQRPVDLPLASGKTVRGVVESANDREVVVRVGPEEVRRVPWAQLRPLGAFRVRKALAPPADGEARLQLAVLAVELGLYVEAREEFEKALALGALDRAGFDELVAGAEHRAVEIGVAQALRTAEAGDLEAALDTARELKMHFTNAPNAREIDRLVSRLVKQVRELEEEAAVASRELEDVRLEAERNKEILRRRTEAVGLIEEGRSEAVKAAEYRQKGNVTRARKYAEAANEAFDGARRHLGRLRRILSADDPTRREILTKLNDLDRYQFELLFDTAWFFWEQRVYSKAEEFAARASFVDPVHPELLDLRDQLRRARIRYRLSDITNARGRVSGPR